MPDDWSLGEVEAIVADYFAMWALDLRGIKFNKAEHNRRLREILRGRNRSSVEKKHQNISAVLWHLGYPYLRGYKPLPRYQRLLRDVVEARLVSEGDLNSLVATAVSEPAKSSLIVRDSKAVVVAPPKRKDVKKLVDDEPRHRTNFARRNYLELEAANQSLGLAGEKFVLGFEHERLWRAGKRALADRIEHVAQTKGDFLGYDILSFETDGRERLIEVKTTRYGELTRFFASANEVAVSERYKGAFHLHRLFNFDKKPQLFVLSGSLKDSCQLKPISYSAVPL